MAVDIQLTANEATELARVAVENDTGKTVTTADMAKTKEFIIAPIVQAILEALEDEGIIVTS